MLRNLKDLKIVAGDKEIDIDKKIQKKLGISFLTMKEALSLSVINDSFKIANSMINIAPNGDYSLLIEDSNKIDSFLKEEAHKPEHWVLTDITTNDKLFVFSFFNLAVDEGNSFKGFVYVDKKGCIKHSFAQDHS